MDRPVSELRRRELLAMLGGLALVLPVAARAQATGHGLGGTLTNLLGQASDGALDQLAKPGAFYGDPAVRIGLPMLGGGVGRGLGSALDMGQQLGVTGNVVRKLNDAAGVAAGEAKPIFRNAIGQLSIADVPGIATQNDGGTQYLRRSAGEDLHGRLRPLIDTALGDVGAFREVDKLSRRSSLLRSAGITRDRLGASVTEQALNGTFAYIGAEEGRLRTNPMGAAGGLLKGILGN